MKNIILIFIATFLSFTLHAQNIVVKETSRSISMGIKPALSVTIYGMSEDDVLKAIQKKLKDFDGKTSEKKGEVFADNCMIKSVGNTPDIYATTSTLNKEETELNLFVDLGGAFMDSKNANEFAYFKTWLHDFSVEETKKVIMNNLENATKVLESKNKDLSNLINKNESLNKEIKDCESTISINKDALEINQKDQTDKKSEIEKEKETVNDIQKKLDNVK